MRRGDHLLLSPRARWSRTRKAAGLSPNTCAASAGVSPSQLTSIKASRSLGRSSASATVTSTPVSCSSVVHSTVTVASRACSARTRRAPRMCVPRTFRATASSHHLGSWGHAIEPPPRDHEHLVNEVVDDLRLRSPAHVPIHDRVVRPEQPLEARGRSSRSGLWLMYPWLPPGEPALQHG